MGDEEKLTVWQCKRLGDVCEIDKTQGMNQGLPYVGMEDIGSANAEFIGSMELKQVKSSTFVFSVEHILYGRLRPYLNKVLMPEFSGHCSTEIFPIKPSALLCRKFLLYWFLSDVTVEKINSTCTGARMPRANMKEVMDIDIYVPPLSEQKRIVAILDEAFAGINLAVANAEKNLANARELFESYLNNFYTQKGDGWEEAVMSDFFDVRDGTHDSPKYVEVGVPFVTQKNIREDGLCFEKTKFISESDHEKFYKRSNVFKGDILISMIGANRGMVCLVDDSRIFSIKNVGLIKSSSKMNMRFILYYFKSSIAKEYIELESRGGAQPFIGLTKLRAFPITLAQINVQNSVVNKLDTLEAEIRQLEVIYQQKLTALNELKQSILQKAFSGQLTRECDNG